MRFGDRHLPGTSLVAQFLAHPALVGALLGCLGASLESGIVETQEIFLGFSAHQT